MPRTPLLSAVVFLVAMCLLAPTFAFAGKSKVPAAFRDKLYDVQFVSDNEVFTVGYPGLILFSDDAGKSWTRNALEEPEPFFAIDFVDRNHGWVVGRSGLIYATVDGGKTWAKQISGITESLFNVDFFDANNGIVVGNFGSVAHTTNGGKTWTPVMIEMMQSAGFNSVVMTGPQSAIAVGEYPMWETELVEEITVDHISNLWQTTDGGATWARIPPAVPKTLYDIVFVDSTTAYAAGNSGTLIKSIDAGQTWTSIKTPYDNLLMNIAVTDKTLRIAGTEGVVLEVVNDQVKVLDTKLFTWLCGIGFADSNRGVAVGARGTVLYTTDGGKTWTKHPIK